MPEEGKAKISKAMKGKPKNYKVKGWEKGHIPWNKGIPCAEETKNKISNTLKGNIPWNKGKSKNGNNT